MKTTPNNVRNMPLLSVQEGYDEWSATYEQTVVDEMDLRLLRRLTTVNWDALTTIIDLACGTGRTATWLRSVTGAAIDGIDLSPGMLDLARAKNVHRTLHQGDITSTGLEAGVYDLAVESLAEEHLRDLAPLYREARRLTTDAGLFVLIGLHPSFLRQGMIAHFDRPTGDSIGIESYLHDFSDHVRAAYAAGWHLLEFEESLVDERWLMEKPKWKRFENEPASFAMVWRTTPRSTS